MVRHLVNHCTNVLKKHVLVTATSGTAASRLPGGKTLHSTLALGQGNKTSIINTSFKPGSTQYAECKTSSVLIIDEAFMLTADFLLTAISKYASSDNVSQVEDIIALKGVILVGDENQLPPVCFHKPTHFQENEDTLKPPCMRCLTNKCVLFEHATMHTLSIPERQKSDLEFSKFLADIHKKVPSKEDIERVLGKCVLLPEKHR